jgi:AcrR family transcriptional regulator
MRADPEERREQLLRAAIEEATAVGYQNITREGVAKRADVSKSLVSHYFDTVDLLRRLILSHAIEHEVLPIIAQAMAAQDKQVRLAEPALKQRAASYLAGVHGRVL